LPDSGGELSLDSRMAESADPTRVSEMRQTRHS
jgi:hypothetical protein